ncbi:carboxypeptidase-like regulatory domain-containing protein [Ferruginibacter albus]|uniref:carboxypeptidase-like regulatory domain-containing protein n=1 Tax=Ferruginibacter albus TaxID=2875540 RepID=UPI001CC3CF78|nr:carboxypeptidase-like regulatory domain-containing protein [Ferruginibacter albus]UAY52674.1 carboxypeptidase-like regulatory domain-containing protein [Ferruginibacter albus]
MKKLLQYILITALFFPLTAKAQFESFKDSVVQLYGVVMTADSLQAVQAASIVVKGQNRGTITNEQGVFSIVVLKGDSIEFSCVGYKPKTIVIPTNIQGNQYSVIQLMTTDTVYLAATIIKARPSKEQFERDFLKTKVPDDNLEIARKNMSEKQLRFLAATMPRDAREASSLYLRQQAAKTYYSGQIPPQNIFNPFAWNEFIKAWKRGDFKNQPSTLSTDGN